MEMNENILGGALWVNFLNTKRMVGGHIIDILEDKSLFTEWLKDNEVSLLSEETCEYQMEQFKDLRGNFNVIMEEFTKGVPIGDIKALEAINKTLETIPAILTATFKDYEPAMEFHACDKSNELLLQIIQSFLNTWKVHSLVRVRQCAHEECILYFLDISKSGKRKWCSMETCGNRKKAAKHYHKNKDLS